MTTLSIGLRNGRVLRRIELRGRERLSIGRSPRCDIHLPAANVSRRHALLFRSWLGWHLVDTGSRRGIRTGGAWVRQMTLHAARTASIGPVDLWLDHDDRECRGPFTLRWLPHLVRDEPSAVLEGPLLVVMDGNEGGMHRFPLAGLDLVTVGRDRRCDAVLDDEGVSRLHCVLYTEHRGWYVADAGSAGGTRVRGRRTLRRRLRDDLPVQIGDSLIWSEGNHRYSAHGYDDGGPLAADAPLGTGATATATALATAAGNGTGIPT